MRRINIYQQPEWPEFTWKMDMLSPLLGEVKLLQGYLSGRMEALGFSLKDEAVLQTLTTEVVKSSEIEGENWMQKYQL